MFNPLRTDQLIAGMGKTMRAAAAGAGEEDEYARGQLLSAYSISRLLAAEVRSGPELLAWLKRESLACLERGEGPAAARAAARIEAAAGAAAVGEALVDLFAELRRDGGDPRLRAELHAVLRELAARELALLAARPERTGREG